MIQLTIWTPRHVSNKGIQCLIILPVTNTLKSCQTALSRTSQFLKDSQIMFPKRHWTMNPFPGKRYRVTNLLTGVLKGQVRRGIRVQAPGLFRLPKYSRGVSSEIKYSELSVPIFSVERREVCPTKTTTYMSKPTPSVCPQVKSSQVKCNQQSFDILYSCFWSDWFSQERRANRDCLSKQWIYSDQ